MAAVLPDAITIALLGAIESLLSAVVADSMSGAHHRSNGELGAQGVANIASVIFGGICVTGTIARTATNVRAGSRGPISGLLHCIYLLLFLFVAAPLVGYIPLTALGAVLVVVAWNMAEKEEFWSLLRSSRADWMRWLGSLARQRVISASLAADTRKPGARRRGGTTSCVITRTIKLRVVSASNGTVPVKSS